MNKFHEEKNEHATSFISRNQHAIKFHQQISAQEVPLTKSLLRRGKSMYKSTERTACNKFQEQKSLRNKFQEQKSLRNKFK